MAHLWTGGRAIVDFCGPLVNFGGGLLDHYCTVLDSLVILSLGVQLETFLSLPCSEGLEWV